MLHGVKNLIWHKSMLELSTEYKFTGKIESFVSGSVFLFNEERGNHYSEMERTFDNLEDFERLLEATNQREDSLFKNLKFEKKE